MLMCGKDYMFYYMFVTYLWLLTQDHYHPNIVVLCSRSVAGVDVDPDLVHMEIQDSSGGAPPLALHYSHLFTLH